MKSYRDDVVDVLVSAATAVREGLQKLCTTGKQILFVVDEGKLVASVTDGDVRRYLLSGGSLDDAIAKAANTNPKFLFSTERERAHAVLAESPFCAVPIVDDDMSILDVVFLREKVEMDAVSMRELILADVPMVMEFFDQMAGDTRAMFNRADVNRFRVLDHLNSKADDHQIHFAAVVREPDGSDTMVGYVFLWDLDKKIPWLGVAVRESWKGHHLGRRLLQYLDDWAKPKGYGGLMLTSVPANVRAHALYTRMGFEYFGVYPDSEFLFIKRYAI